MWLETILILQYVLSAYFNFLSLLLFKNDVAGKLYKLVENIVNAAPFHYLAEDSKAIPITFDFITKFI